jgi:hypothetical protein
VYVSGEKKEERKGERFDRFSNSTNLVYFE